LTDEYGKQFKWDERTGESEWLDSNPEEEEKK